jgi:hypothetical protein
MVNADLDDVTSLTTAFQGAYAIFSVLDFWTGFFNPANESKVKAGQTMLEWAHDYELQQGKNVFAAAAQTQGLERLIFSALSYATKWSGGKYKHIYLFDAEGKSSRIWAIPLPRSNDEDQRHPAWFASLKYATQAAISTEESTPFSLRQRV